MQTLLAMSHALTGEPDLTVIESRGVRHRVTFAIDPITREPRLEHQTANFTRPDGNEGHHVPAGVVEGSGRHFTTPRATSGRSIRT